MWNCYDKYRHLLRLHSLTGTWLLMLPCLSGAALVSTGSPDIWHMLLLFVGAFVMRSAGCIVNDLIDKDIDSQVERTKGRPIASGKISVKEALICLFILCSIAGFLLLFMNGLVFALALIFALPIAIYPLCKRLFFMPQIFLGFVFGSGAIFGSALVTEQVSASSIIFYLGCVFWIIGYDTIYACQDRKYDLALGLNSSAIILFHSLDKWLLLFYKIAFFLWVIAGALEGLGVLFYMVIPGAAYFLYRQIKYTNFNDPEQCMSAFKSNVVVGLFVLISYILGSIY